MNQLLENSLRTCDVTLVTSCLIGLEFLMCDLWLAVLSVDRSELL